MIKKIYFLFLFNLFSTSFFSQTTSFQVWTETGMKGKINKKLDWNLNLTNRFLDLKIVTLFPQLSLKYKVSNWFKPSVDYRYIANRENNGNYTTNHRVNFNLQFEKAIKRFDFELRLRYQYSFKGINTNYEPEFDNSIRFRPSLSYNIKKSFLSPTMSTELFYNPSDGLYGKRLTRIRLFMGFNLNLKGPHELQLGYFFDQKINIQRSENRNVFNLEYTYSIPNKLKK